jgi:hypothetical protein
VSANQQCDEHMPTAYATSNATSICTDGRNGRTELTKNLGHLPEITPSSVTRGRTYADVMIPCPTCGTLMPSDIRLSRPRLHCSKSCAGRSANTLAHLAEISRMRVIAGHDVDDVVVTRLLSGVPVASTRSERIEAVAYLTLRGRSALWIAAQLHITTRSVCRYRAELNQRTTTRKVA